MKVKLSRKGFRKKQFRGARIADLFKAIDGIKISTMKKLNERGLEGVEHQLSSRLEALEIIEYVINIYFPEYPMDGDGE